MNSDKILGQALCALRKKLGKRQKDVAAAAGMSSSQLSNYENGLGNPQWGSIVKLLELGLGCTIFDLAREMLKREPLADDGVDVEMAIERGGEELPPPEVLAGEVASLFLKFYQWAHNQPKGD